MRAGYGAIQRIPTRWMDNDVYGHVNNVVYYSYFDTVINTWLIQHAGLNIHHSAQIGLCAESHCKFLAPIEFPQIVEAALRVEKLGRSSVRYGIGLFVEGETTPAAEGWFVHVFVDRATRRSTPIPEPMRRALETLLWEPSP
jgi:acyl-CoA thioester hydrolase